MWGTKSINDTLVLQILIFQKFKEEYACEIKFNDEFNNFVRNFELAYWGPNTAHHQIRSPYDIG